jgi:hypothetical protein
MPQISKFPAQLDITVLRREQVIRRTRVNSSSALKDTTAKKLQLNHTLAQQVLIPAPRVPLQTQTAMPAPAVTTVLMVPA